MNRMFDPFSTFATQMPGLGITNEYRSVPEMFSSLVAELEYEYSSVAELGVLLAFLSCAARIHQSHHWQSKGPGFYGDHLLFQRIYDETLPQVDALAERCVGMGGEPLVDVMMQMDLQERVCRWICEIYAQGYTDVFQKSAAVEECVLAAIDFTTESMAQRGTLKLGVENLLGGFADKHEEFQYLLQRPQI